MQSVDIPRFGGLNVDADPEDVGLTGAIDLLNVDFDREGRLRTRDGYAQFNDVTLSSTNYQALMPFAGNSGVLLGVRRSVANILLDKFTGTGAATNIGTFAASATTTVGNWASLGTATATYLYYTLWDATTGYTVQKYDGTTLGTGTGKPGFVAVLPNTNRLAQAHYFAAADSPSGANGSKSTVFFSDPGAPDTYTASNYVQLSPGDGENIAGMVTWRDQLYVFKESRMFVFYGISTDATGGAVFNYRTVDLPVPLWTVAGYTAPFVTVGPDGVYISTPRGIFRTTGDTPSLLSGPVQKLWTLDTEFSPRFNGVPPLLSWAADRLFALYTDSNSQGRELVYDPRTGQWTIWKLGATNGIQTMPTSFPPAPYTASPSAGLARENVYFTSGNDIMRLNPNSTDDSGTAITWSYQSGFDALGAPGQLKFTRRTRLWGTGTVTVAVYSDHGSTDANSASVTLGSSTTAVGQHSKSYKGYLLSHKLSGSGQAVINRLTHDLAFVGGP